MGKADLDMIERWEAEAEKIEVEIATLQARYSQIIAFVNYKRGIGPAWKPAAGTELEFGDYVVGPGPAAEKIAIKDAEFSDYVF
jgi:hypothetical protein